MFRIQISAQRDKQVVAFRADVSNLDELDNVVPSSNNSVVTTVASCVNEYYTAWASLLAPTPLPRHVVYSRFGGHLHADAWAGRQCQVVAADQPENIVPPIGRLIWRRVE
jgi:hypothetical protein